MAVGPQRLALPTQRVRCDEPKQRGKAWVVRWRVDGVGSSKSFPTKATAAHFRRHLLNAADLGEVFDPDKRLPESWLSGVKLVDFAQTMVAKRWPGSVARTRGNMLEETIWAVLALTDTPVTGARHERLRAVLRLTLRPTPPNAEAPKLTAAQRRDLAWLRTHSLGLRDIRRRHCLAAFEGFRLNLDGSPADADTFRKRRTGVTRLLNAAVDAELITSSPAAGIRMQALAANNDAVVRAEVPSVAQALELIEQCGKRSPQARRLVAYLAVTLYAGLRPGEVNALRPGSVDLPAKGWGEARVGRSRTITTKANSGAEVAYAEGLTKTRSSRTVPLHPDLVALIRGHTERWPNKPTEPIFTTASGRVLNENIDRVLGAAREQLGWTDGHPLAGTHHYTLRHTAATVAIEAGLPLTVVADRMGHSVSELMRTYWNIIHGQDRDEMNQRLEAAYRPQPRVQSRAKNVRSKRASP
jgi:integrase